MLGLMFRLIFSLGAIAWYSLSVWNMIADYFSKEFKRVLLNDTGDIEIEDEL
ncbi:hypothetical protein JYU34_008807 [Plutella xylostella]|uniref:Uncharacterized protein n=1 Tax=Plutella xylostella TaxID=51655 RepID=A0ABQ7QLV3_PLUXY|nr:hypothetical protein JYU34_008807 [Plutella xylostella]